MEGVPSGSGNGSVNTSHQSPDCLDSAYGVSKMWSAREWDYGAAMNVKCTALAGWRRARTGRTRKNAPAQPLRAGGEGPSPMRRAAAAAATVDNVGGRTGLALPPRARQAPRGALGTQAGPLVLISKWCWRRNGKLLLGSRCKREEELLLQARPRGLPLARRARRSRCHSRAWGRRGQPGVASRAAYAALRSPWGPCR